MQRAGIEVTRPDIAPFRARMAPAYEQLRRALGDQAWTPWVGFVDAARPA